VNYKRSRPITAAFEVKRELSPEIRRRFGVTQTLITSLNQPDEQPISCSVGFPHILVEANVVWHCHELLWLSSLTKSRKMDEDT
jgi:hypothetical protein